jgi:hypothetical protein
LNGTFECLLQDDGIMELTDIPWDQGGNLWVWPTFMPGSKAVYSPPAIGFTPSYQFPPLDASGITQTFSITRCQVALWPLLVHEGSDLTLKDITLDNRVIVGLHLPISLTISGLTNLQTYSDTLLDLPDRTLHLLNASIEAWNLYPENDAKITVEGSHVGEILTSGTSSAFLNTTIVDGSGGYFGATDDSTIEAVDSTFTCHIQAAKNASIHLQQCQALPYSIDPTGDFTIYGAFDSAHLHLEGTLVKTKRVLGGKGVIAVTWITDPPAFPPPKGTRNTIHGYAGIYSLDWSTRLSSWTLTAQPIGGPAKRIGVGFTNVENGTLGIWRGPQPNESFELTLTLKDRSKHTYTSTINIPPN